MEGGNMLESLFSIEKIVSKNESSVGFLANIKGCLFRLDMTELQPEQSAKHYMKKIYIVTFFYQAANSLILPIVPYIANKLNANSLQYGLTFTLYYVTQLFSSLGLGKISDRYGRRIALTIAHLGLTIFTLCQLFTTNIWLFLVFRTLTGLFDASTPLFQACTGDVTTNNQRAHYLSQLEAVNNVAQAVGPITGGLLSSISLSICTTILYAISTLASIFILPESNPIIIERETIIINLKQQNLEKTVFEEQKKLLFYQLNMQHNNSDQSSTSKKTRKWTLNYIMSFGLVAEFSARWLINVFDVSFAEYGEEKYQMTSMEFSFTTAIGSCINVIQTGWLFNLFLKWNMSIPLITCFGGITGGIFIVIFSISKIMAICGSLCFIISYGFISPTAPTIMSTEFDSMSQGIATALVLIGGQTAYIIAPSILGGLYPVSTSLPFYISLIPCVIVFISMIVLHLIPGGKTAGQVPLKYALENMIKEAKMEGIDNENELDELGRSGEISTKIWNSKSIKEDDNFKKSNDNEHDISIEMTVMKRKKDDDDNANENIFLQGMRSIDEDDFFIPPRFLGKSINSIPKKNVTTHDVENMENDNEHRNREAMEGQRRNEEEDIAI